MVLTCRPCSGATPTDNKRGISRSITRHLDGDTWPGAEITLDCPLDGADENAIGAVATISMQHGATSSTTGSASPPAASGRTSPPAAKNTAAGAMTAARTADDFRRSVANSCLPTDSTIEQTASCTASFEDPNGWREDRSGGGVVGSPALGCYNSDAYSLTPPNPRRTHFRSSAAPTQSQRRPVGSAFKVGGDPATSSARRPGCFPGVAEKFGVAGVACVPVATEQNHPVPGTVVRHGVPAAAAGADLLHLGPLVRYPLPGVVRGLSRRQTTVQDHCFDAPPYDLDQCSTNTSHHRFGDVTRGSRAPRL